MSTETGKTKLSAKYLFILTYGALGVVYGDIGTSPLYAIKECFHGPHAIHVDNDNIMGVLSLIFWALILIISIKYLIIILRADNEGEGGILALMELVKGAKNRTLYLFIIVIGLFGAALLYGDGIITPAISVLSAVEGLEVATPFFKPAIIPITIVILFILFKFQHKGTAKVGSIFGPIMFIWFSVIGLLGLLSALKNPEIFLSINPFYAYHFFADNGFHGFVVLGSVFLVVTGGEALYADMGHFGRLPIRVAWFTLVLPCLLLNYFGQGALLMREPSAAVNPFYNLIPEWLLYPAVLLATMATVIASQAVISGAFSLTLQALQLGYLPRMRIQHTSEKERGQIYIPQINWILFAATITLVLTFRTSSNLASAYGIAVTSTMVITTILAFVAMRRLWKWSLPLALAISIFFLIIDLAFWGSNILKIVDGGWVPLVMALSIFFIMSTWFSGRKLVREKVVEVTQPIETFIDEYLSIRAMTIQGTAIYMSSNSNAAPLTLVHNIKHNKILHKNIFVLSLKFGKVPRVNTEETLEVIEVTEGFYRVIAHYGFMDNPDVMKIIEYLQKREFNINIEKTTFFLGRETLIVMSTGIRRWRRLFFSMLSNNAERATEYFNIPPHRVFEIGTQLII